VKERIVNYLTDQRFALNLYGNGLVFHSEPFTQATEISGQMKLAAWIALDVPDTDFAATVYEIKRDGTSVLLADDRLRARFRTSLRKEKLVTPGEKLLYELKSFFFISRQIAAGSRLRLVFACPNSIFLEKNYNSGAPLGTETRKDARTARVTLYHDAEHASYLEVPEVTR
jgi:predicted acyl esterase